MPRIALLTQGIREFPVDGEAKVRAMPHPWCQLKEAQGQDRRWQHNPGADLPPPLKNKPSGLRVAFQGQPVSAITLPPGYSVEAQGRWGPD